MPTIPLEQPRAVSRIGRIRGLSNGHWIRSLRAADGTIYFRKYYKSTDGGRTVVSHNEIELEDILRNAAGAELIKPGLFYATDSFAYLVEPGVYRMTAWRCVGDFTTPTQEEVLLRVPEGPVRNPREGEFYGLFVFRSLVERLDGSWLMTMYGNFAADTTLAWDRNAGTENSAMQRAFVVLSQDQGRTWDYLATIAAPRAGDPIGEGFVEPTMTRVADGRLLCILRTGHHYPLYASWSSDDGETWTPPVYTGLDRGCDPCLLALQDGRVALSWGRRFPEGWSQVSEVGDEERFQYPGEGFTNLAISSDCGITWVNHKIGQGTGSCYSCIHEVEPNVLLCQVDEWYWRIRLRPG
jgi:hypothetical protein